MEEYGFEAVNVLVQEELLGQRIFPKFRKTPVKIEGFFFSNFEKKKEKTLSNHKMCQTLLLLFIFVLVKKKFQVFLSPRLFRCQAVSPHSLRFSITRDSLDTYRQRSFFSFKDWVLSRNVCE